MPRPAGPLVVLALVGCGHSDPFPPPGGGAEVPFNPTLPVQLTYSPAEDRSPAWRPDGSGLLYVFQRTDHPDGDRCLGELPPSGGTRRIEKCVPGDAGHDSVNVFETAAFSPMGSLAWVEQTGLVGGTPFLGGSIRTGTLAPADRGTPLRTLPYVAPDGRPHSTATHLNWLDPGTLVYVGADIALTRSCASCRLDTLILTRDIVTLTASAPAPQLAIVPGTGSATSVWPSRDGSTLYYTVAGSSRVLQHVLGSGAVSTLYDFGIRGIARDVVVRDSTLVAIVGGAVSWASEPTLPGQEFVQRDSGGTLYLVHLNSGVANALSAPTARVRHPALSPDGRQVAAEIVAAPGSAAADLFLFATP